MVGVKWLFERAGTLRSFNGLGQRNFVAAVVLLKAVR